MIRVWENLFDGFGCMNGKCWFFDDDFVICWDFCDFLGVLFDKFEVCCVIVIDIKGFCWCVDWNEDYVWFLNCFIDVCWKI